MRPDEHYQAAEAILNQIEEYDLSSEPALLIAVAQAHATLATARPADAATGAAEPTIDGELRDAFSAWKVARIGNGAQTERAAYQNLIGVIARIDDDLRREHWIGKIKGVSFMDIRQIRRAVNELRG